MMLSIMKHTMNPKIFEYFDDMKLMANLLHKKLKQYTKHNISTMHKLLDWIKMVLQNWLQILVFVFLAKRLELAELTLKAINAGSERDHEHAERRCYDRDIVQKVCKNRNSFDLFLSFVWTSYLKYFLCVIICWLLCAVVC